jgi:hypothetical protein
MVLVNLTQAVAKYGWVTYDVQGWKMTWANALFLDGEHIIVVTTKMLVLHVVGIQFPNII